MELFNFFKKKTEIKAPLNIFKLIEKLNNNSLLLKYSEICDVNNFGIIKTTKPIMCNKKFISIKIFEKNKSFEISSFDVIDKHTIVIKKNDMSLWRIIDIHTPEIKKVKVDFYTENTENNYKLFVRKNALYIKASLSGYKYCMTNDGILAQDVKTFVFDTKEKKIIIKKCSNHYLVKDIDTNDNYHMFVNKKGNIRLVPEKYIMV